MKWLASRLHRFIHKLYPVKNTKESVFYIIRNVIKLSLNRRIIADRIIKKNIPYLRSQQPHVLY